MFFTLRFYIAIGIIILLLGGGYLFHTLFIIGQVVLCAFALLLLLEGIILYRSRGITAFRTCSDRFSNGDDNIVRLRVENAFRFSVRVEVTDEIPAVFQLRDLNFRFLLAGGEGKTVEYMLHPTHRGEYEFGRIRVFVSIKTGFISRLFTCGDPLTVKVYPSFLMLRRYELLAINDNLIEFGIKKIRRIGRQTEFEQIKEYVQGDDYRTINWKASARRHELMVNVYQDERSQQLYNIIDKGRVMQQAFRGMTLLDYAINASLVLSYVAMHKEDKTGLVTFNEKFDTFINASRQSGHLQTLLENLYNQKTDFGETDFSALCAHLSKYVSKQSLLVLYTNFSGITALNRQLSYLRQLSRRHKLLVVIFENAELKEFITRQPERTEDYYRQVIARKFAFEQRLVVTTLQQHGIYALLTPPENLSIDVINGYLEMRRG